MYPTQALLKSAGILPLI